MTSHRTQGQGLPPLYSLAGIGHSLRARRLLHRATHRDILCIKSHQTALTVHGAPHMRRAFKPHFIILSPPPLRSILACACQSRGRPSSHVRAARTPHRGRAECSETLRGPLREAEVIGDILVEESRAQVGLGFSALPTDPLRLDLAQLVRAGVVRVHDEEARLARLLRDGQSFDERAHH